jgi:hypothetical protein
MDQTKIFFSLQVPKTNVVVVQPTALPSNTSRLHTSRAVDAAISQCSQLMNTIRKNTHYELMLNSNYSLKRTGKRQKVAHLSSIVANHMQEAQLAQHQRRPTM